MKKEDLQRVIELDKHATKGPWAEHVAADGKAGIFGPSVEMPIAWSRMNSIYDLCAAAHYRTAAPEMARMLLEIHEEMEIYHSAGMDSAAECVNKIKRIIER